MGDAITPTPPTTLAGASVAIPVDLQANYRAQAVATTVALGGSATYTSAGYDALNFRRITVRVFADQTGTLHIDHSDDGVTWDTSGAKAVSASTAAFYDEAIYARHVRLRYVNGSSAQGTFRLHGYASVL